jgi:hypothetical protein
VNEISEAWSAGTVLVVSIPLTLRKRLISQRLNKLLKQHHKRGRGQRTFRESRARYRIAAQFSRHSLEKALDAYDLHKAKPELTLWQIAQQLRLSVGQALNKDELAKGRGVDKKRILAIAAHKKLALAKKIVDGVGRGVFPAIATRKGLGKNHR